ncbi:hypothetical protein OESDEN_11611 [Oesophagostomum dentatum]|uniref:N-acetyltransferase domain-containing protein n=1 Tax=Oesophagostomum dentatum TaxID=61180 RepID=A0A0B1SYM8_OESDE|nr:hypothetical protein OESDEN_11611 [Oesophagostomum dentatum]
MNDEVRTVNTQKVSKWKWPVLHVRVDLANAFDGKAEICEEIHGSIWRLLDPRIDTVLELDILSVALPYQRRGIAGKMLEKRKSPELLKDFHIQGFVCQASSIANQMLLRKRGHQELKDVPFSRFVDENGVQLIRPRDQTRSVKLFWKPYCP